MEIKIKSIEKLQVQPGEVLVMKLQVQPGEVLVMKLPKGSSSDAFAAATVALSRNLPGIKCLICDEDVNITVLALPRGPTGKIRFVRDILQYEQRNAAGQLEWEDVPSYAPSEIYSDAVRRLEDT